VIMPAPPDAPPPRRSGASGEDTSANQVQDEVSPALAITPTTTPKAGRSLPLGVARRISGAMYRSPVSREWNGAPLAYGGHMWEPYGPLRLPPRSPGRRRPAPGATLWRCTRCHYPAVTTWELAEGFWRVRAGDWCPGAMRALPSGGAS
jgi:hypothetical protein